MMRDRQAWLLTFLVVVGTTVLAPSASAAMPRCGGERATIVGTERADVIVGTDRRDVIVGLGGGDSIRGGGRGDLICAGRGSDVVKGGDGIDFLFGEEGDDRLIGGIGLFNQIIPGPGDDFVDGGPNTPDRASDELVYLDAANGIVADLGAGTATGEGDDEISNIEWLIGSSHDDVLIGSDRDFEVIFGAGGNDVIDALGGEDAMAGGAGDDDIDGGDGFDMLADWILTDIYGLTPVSGLTVDLVAGTLTGNGSDTLTSISGSQGSPGDDVMIGDDLDNDFVILIDGDDTVDAGGGEDLVDGGDGADALDGGAGVDLLGHLDLSNGVTVDLAAGTTSQGDTFASFEDVIGSFFDDVLTGDAGKNRIEGADGADEISGLGGDDVLFGGWADGFDDGSPDSTDGGDGADACDAETETNCEGDPMFASRASWTSMLAKRA